jgi:starvation-inducible DNA-binding protein
MAKKSGKNSDKMVSALKRVLADTYVLAVKTHGYHWNVTGPLFPQLHAQFSEQYTALFTAADDLAERIRALGAPAPGGMAQFLAQTGLLEAPGKLQSSSAMIKDLVASREKLSAEIGAAIELADDVDDDVTEDLLITQHGDHQKTIWMLKSQLD